jgi:hypothetical protein
MGNNPVLLAGFRGGAGGRAELNAGRCRSTSGSLALFVSALQGSLAVGSAAGGVIYDAAGPGGTLVVAAAVAAAGSLALLGRAGAAISSSSGGFAYLAREAGRVVPALSQRATDEQEAACNEHADVAVAAMPRPPSGRNCHAQRGCDDRVRTA